MVNGSKFSLLLPWHDKWNELPVEVSCWPLPLRGVAYVWNHRSLWRLPVLRLEEREAGMRWNSLGPPSPLGRILFHLHSYDALLNAHFCSLNNVFFHERWLSRYQVPKTESVPEMNQASSYLQGPPRLAKETRDLWNKIVNAGRKVGGSRGKINSDGPGKGS